MLSCKCNGLLQGRPLRDVHSVVLHSMIMWPALVVRWLLRSCSPQAQRVIDFQTKALVAVVLPEG